jgi:hypothetical protein
MQPSIIPVARTGTPEQGHGTLFLVVQPPNVGHALMLLGNRLLAGKRRVGYWMWELETLPTSWRRSAALMHDIAAPSRFAATALARGLGVPTRLLNFPLLAAPARATRRARAGPLTFGVGFDLGSTAARKNPFAAIEAFQRAFTASDPVRLLLKVRGEAADPRAFAKLSAIASAAPGVELATGDLDVEGMERWWSEIDVLVSLHRSEGFGLFPAEAMLQGIPVITTDWSATSEFVTGDAGWPIPPRLMLVSDATGRYELPGARWADPDLDAAARAMRAALTQGWEERARRGRNAATVIAERFSLSNFQRQLTGGAEFTIPAL